MYTADDLQKIAEQFYKSNQKEVDKIVALQAPLDTSEVIEIAKEVRMWIMTNCERLGIYRSWGWSWADDEIVVGKPILDKTTGKYEISITFSQKFLHRDSLYDPFYDERTGGGVYDIIGLFTNGYEARRRVYGIWTSHGEEYADSDHPKGGMIIGSRRSLPANDFIKTILDDMKSKYPIIQKITYPKLWGGNN